MRILLTTDTVGGVWTFTRELTAGLLERGHAVALVSLGRAPSRSQRDWTLGVELQYGTTFRYEDSEGPLEWMGGNRFAYSDAEGLLLRVTDEFEAEIVHANQFCFGALPVDLPKVVTGHSDVLSWAEACRPAGLEESAWLRQYKALVSAGLAGADAVVAPTCWMREALARNFSASAGARVILNGRTVAAGEEHEPRRLLAVTVGRLWDEAKGLAVIREVEAFMPIVVIGETSFEGGQAPELRTVEFLGRLDEKEVLKSLRRSSLYLATSIYEPFGLAPLEAALCGCGVIARDIPSLREVWGHAAEYFTDGRGLGEVLARLRESPAQLMALQHRSMERALELSAARMADVYIALYEELLAMPRTQREMIAYVS